MTVTSKDNHSVKLWQALCREPRRRRESGCFAIEGARLCGDALASGLAVEVLLYTVKAKQSYAEVVEPLLAAAAQAVEISSDLAQHMADTAHPQGIFCIVKSLDNRLRLDKMDSMGRYGILENIQDPGNLGTIIRTAEALGLNGLLLSAGCCDIYNPKVLRSSMGGVFRLPLQVVENVPETVTALQQTGLTVFACVVDPDAASVHSAGLGPGSVCAIGNEGSGLHPETVAACARHVTIRMAGRAESLNASLAAGIVMWEMTRP